MKANCTIGLGTPEAHAAQGYLSSPFRMPRPMCECHAREAMAQAREAGDNGWVFWNVYGNANGREADGERNVLECLNAQSTT